MKKRYRYLLPFVVGLTLFSSGTRGQIPNIEEKPFSNPALIFGSDFLTIFQIYYKQANWEMMMRLTSSKSIEKYGYNSIVDYYKRMDFGYRIRLNSIQKNISEIQMNYQGTILATRQIIRCDVEIEDDTCKIILPPEFSFTKYFLISKRE